MNTYYHNNSRINSNNDIFESYFYGEAHAAPAWKRYADKLLAILASLLTILTGTVARRLVRAAAISCLLIAMVGLVGAVELGTVGLGVGFGIGIALIAFEFLCLRKMK